MAAGGGGRSADLAALEARLRRDLLAEAYAGSGAFRDHLGDATGWAGEYYCALGEEATPEESRVLDAILARVRRLATRPFGPKGEREEAGLGLLATLAAVETGRASPADRRLLGAALKAASLGALAQGGLLRRPRASFDAASVTAALAYGNLRYAATVRSSWHAGVARRLLRKVEDARNRTLALPAFLLAMGLARDARPDEARAVLAEADSRFWDAPVGAWRGAAGGPHAAPPYYLAFQLFGALAGIEIAQASGASADLARAREALDFVVRKLDDGRRLLHDWDPAKGAAGWHCVGCNYQAIVVLRALRRSRP